MAYANNSEPITEILERLPVVLSPETPPISESKSRYIERRLLESNPILVTLIRKVIDDLSRELSSNPDLHRIEDGSMQITDPQLKGVIARTALTTLSVTSLALGLAMNDLDAQLQHSLSAKNK